jgi:hypothetical protein
VEARKAHGYVWTLVLYFFYIVPQLVLALVVMYDEIFHSLTIEGDILFPKPFLDFGFDGVVRWKPPASEMLFQFSKRVKVRGGQFRAVRRWSMSRNGFGSGTFPFAARAWKVSSYVMTIA